MLLPSTQISSVHVESRVNSPGRGRVNKSSMFLQRRRERRAQSISGLKSSSRRRAEGERACLLENEHIAIESDDPLWKPNHLISSLPALRKKQRKNSQSTQPTRKPFQNPTPNQARQPSRPVPSLSSPKRAPPTPSPHPSSPNLLPQAHHTLVFLSTYLNFVQVSSNLLSCSFNSCVPSVGFKLGTSFIKIPAFLHTSLASSGKGAVIIATRGYLEGGEVCLRA